MEPPMTMGSDTNIQTRNVDTINVNGIELMVLYHNETMFKLNKVTNTLPGSKPAVMNITLFLQTYTQTVD